MSGRVLTVGVPREIKAGEKRVGLTPEGVRVLREAGIPVLIEKGAGEQSNFPDQEYQRAGAEMIKGARNVYRNARLIKKVKEPLSPEWDFLKESHILFCYLHLASPENRKLVEILIERKVIGMGLETVEKNGRTIFLEPMSEIAGTLAGYFSGFFRQTVRVEGRKIIYPVRFLEKLEWLATHFPDIPENLSPGRVAIFGGGSVGLRAAETVLKMGGHVDLIEKREERRQFLEKELKDFKDRVRVLGVEENGGEILKRADVWIGCVHVVGKRAPLVMSQDELKLFSREKPKLILDIAMDQGGNFPETHSTKYEDPLYLDSSGNLRFGVTNVPSLCGRGASAAIESVTLPYTVRLAQDWKKALLDLPELQKGVQVFDGKLVNEAVALAHQLPHETFKL